MIARIFFLLIICLNVFPSSLRAQQQQHIVMRADEKRAEILILKDAMEDTALCKNLPFNLAPAWKLKKIAYNPIQYMYEDVLAGKRTLKSFQEFAFYNPDEVDTNYISRQRIKKNNVYLFTAVDSVLKKKYIVVDANNDLDFTNDSVYVFNLDGSIKRYPELSLKIAYFDGAHIQDAEITVQVDAYQDKEGFYEILPVWSGSYTIDGHAYKVHVDNYNRFYPHKAFSVQIGQAGSGTVYAYSYRSTDTLQFGYHRYRVEDFADTLLILKDVGRGGTAGAEINTSVPTIVGLDVMTAAAFDSRTYSGKWMLLDFWGSWCAPCIKAIPVLTAAHDHFGDEVVFVSIAFDRVSKLEEVKKIITEHKMNWHHVLDSMDTDKSGISKTYQVSEYPTVVLINPQGNIAFRSVAETGLKKAVEYLNQHLK